MKVDDVGHISSSIALLCKTYFLNDDLLTFFFLDPLNSQSQSINILKVKIMFPLSTLFNSSRSYPPKRIILLKLESKNLHERRPIKGSNAWFFGINHIVRSQG